MVATSPERDRRVFGWLLAAAVPVLFLALGANAIWDANEAFYVETPRQMVLSGDYINPSFNGEPRFNKPVLSYWMVAGLYQAFGISVAVERAGIAAGAVAILLATFLIGRALAGARTGILAALIVVTAPRFVMFARRIFIDIWITAFMALTLACFTMALRHPERRQTWLVLMYVAIGLGVLTKGPQAFVLPALAGGVWMVLEGRLGDMRRMMLLPGALIVLAIVVPWYAAQIPEHGFTYIQSFFIGENVGRYSTSMVPSDRSAFFYLPVLFGDLFPWAPLLIVPMLAAWRGRSAGESDTDAGIRRLLWVWIVTITGLFTFSATKQDLYIFPVVPAVAVLVAQALVTSDFGMARRAVAGLLSGVAVLSVAAAGGLWWLLTDGPYAMRDTALVAGLLGATGLVTLGLMAARRGRDAVIALAAGFVLLNYAFVLRALPDAERFKPAPPIAAAFTAGAGAEAQLTALDVGLPSLVYYAGRTVHELGATRQAAELLAGEAEVWLVLPRAAWEEIAPQVPGACVILRRPQFAFNARLSDIIDRTPPDDILLVANRCRG